MLLRRCAIVFVEPRENLDLDLAALFSGVSALGAKVRWVALAPHVDAPLEVDEGEMAALGALGPSLWLERDDCAARYGDTVVRRLLQLGLLIGDDPAHAGLRARDESVRAVYWQPLSAIAHVHSRWHDMKGENGKRFPSFEELVESLGLPPPATLDCAPEQDAIVLPAPPPGALDETLLRRYTGRNYDGAAVLPLALAARLLQRSFGAQQQRTMMPGAVALKKTSPSGGGLHPVEAYVLAQRVDGVAPGLYHYHPLRHVLEPMRALSAEAAAALALSMVADQDWFANAPLLVVLAARVERTFWKYRDHAKAYRVLLLDAGHLAQTFQLLAAEAGLPAFITAGINEVNIERAFGFDPVQHAVLAVCGCGAAADTPGMTEFR